MGLFTRPAPTSRRPGSTARLKRRSLGRTREKSSETSKDSADPQIEGQDVKPPLTKLVAPVESAPQGYLQSTIVGRMQTAASASDLPSSAPEKDARSEEEPEPELTDLQSDNIFLYHREAPLESALGLRSLRLPELDLLECIDDYVAEHYLDCFGITQQDELVRHHTRAVHFHAKAPRFLSIHSLRRKELERDFTEVADTIQTCPRQELCLGRCLLGCSCPTQDLPSQSS